MWVFPVSGFLVNPLQKKIAMTLWWDWHEAWTSNWIWQEKQNNVKKFDDDAMSGNHDFIVIFPIYRQLGAIRKPDSRAIVYKSYKFIKSKLLSYKNWKQN